MSQSTRRLLAEAIDSFEKQSSLPFAEVLDAGMVEEALAAEGVTYNRSIYTPFVTLCTFLSQVLDPDHSCRAAVSARSRTWTAPPCCSTRRAASCSTRLVPTGSSAPPFSPASPGTSS